MITDPAGNRRVGTPQEILEAAHARRLARQDIRRSQSVSHNVRGTNKDTNIENRQSGQMESGLRSVHEGTSGTLQELKRSIDGTDESMGREAGANGSGYSSTYQHNERFTTEEQYNSATIIPEVKRSRWDTFTGGVKQAFKKGEQKQEKKAKRPRAKLISAVEARMKRDQLIQTLLWLSEHFDEVIIATTKGHDHSIIIWSDLDKDDATFLADELLSWAQRDVRGAVVVDQLLSIRRRIRVAVIVLPRIYKSWITYVTRGFSIR